MRIAEAFCKMRLSEYCSAQDIDRAIVVTVDSFIGSQKVSCKKALARAFAKYVVILPILSSLLILLLLDIHYHVPSLSPSAALASPFRTRICRGWCPRHDRAFSGQ